MKKLKAIALCLALLAIPSSLTGCGEKKKPNESSSSSPDSTVVVDEKCKVKGHEYAETDGKCVRCGVEATIPALPAGQKFPLLDHCDDDHFGNCGCTHKGVGTENDRVEINKEEGFCYTVEIPASGEIWLSIPTNEAGQYVFYSVDGANGVTSTRYYANPGLPILNNQGVNAVVKEDNFYSFANCAEAEYSAFWRATFCLKGAAGAKVKVALTRIASAPWRAEYIVTPVEAKQINGKRAENAESGTELADVPYTAEYTLGSDGYYRLSTGEIIYAAIDRPAPRLFGEKTSEESDEPKFTNILRDASKALNITVGTTPEDDFDVRCYVPFIMNWKEWDSVWSSNYGLTPEADLEKECYQNFCNSDGVYPVNEELFEFLNLYTKNYRFADESVADDAKWLSACYYYAESTVGTEENPQPLVLGENTVELPSYKRRIYCTLEGTGSYTITSTSGVAKVSVNGSATQDFTTLTVDGGAVLRFNASDNEATTITFTVTKIEE